MKYLCLLLVLLVSCKEKPNLWGREPQDLKMKNFKELVVGHKDLQVIKINPETKNKIRLSNLIDTCYTVTLETNKSNLIGSIDEIKIYGDRIYVLDKKISKEVFVFDIQGDYIGKIGQKGHGPGEYPKPDGFEIDKINGELLITSLSIRKIFRYDFNGNFLGSISTKISSFDFKILDNGQRVFLSGEEENAHLGELKSKQIYITDRNLNIMSYGPKNRTYFKKFKLLRSANLMVKNREVSYSFKLSDTIYNVYEDSISAKYRLDFGNFGIDKEKLKSITYMDFDKEIRNKTQSAYFMGEHFQTKDYVMITYIYKNMPISCFYNKTERKIIEGIFLNDTPKYPIFHTSIVGVYDNYFVSSIDAYKIVNMNNILKENQKDYHVEFLKKIKNDSGLKIKKTDNPVLLFYKLKEKYNEK